MDVLVRLAAPSASMGPFQLAGRALRSHGEGAAVRAQQKRATRLQPGQRGARAERLPQRLLPASASGAPWIWNKKTRRGVVASRGSPYRVSALGTARAEGEGHDERVKFSSRAAVAGAVPVVTAVGCTGSNGMLS